MNNLWQDIRYGIRTLLKAPSFSIVATVALALGIGANTAIFTVVNAVLLRPLPFPNPEQLMNVWEADIGMVTSQGSVSYPNFADWRDQNQSFQKLAAYHSTEMTLTESGEPARLQAAVVSPDIFSILGATPVAGRTFLPEEDEPGDKGRVVLLSQTLFQKRFNADRNVVGQSIMVDGQSHTIVGVMSQGFAFPLQNEPVELWTTFSAEKEGKGPMTDQRGAHYIRVIGRLKPGVTQQQAQSEMTTIHARLEQQYPDKNLHRTAVVNSTLEDLVRDVHTALLIMLGAVGFVLLIACANVANLLLARAMARHKEIAIRTALGASRWRIMRQLLTESILLSLAGGALGLLLAVWWSALLVNLDRDLPRATDVGLDARVFGFAFLVSLLTGLIFGLVPALTSTKAELTDSLKEGRGAGEGARRNRVRNILVTAELAIAVVLLVGAGLLIQSFWRLHQVHPGFESKNVLTFSLGIPSIKYPTERQDQFYKSLTDRLKSLPGVESASTVAPLPLSGDRYSISFQIDGRPVPEGEEPSADFYTIGLDYFKTMRIPLLEGRTFNEHDQHKAPEVIIVNQSFAKQYFPGQSALGKRIEPGIKVFEDEEPGMREIVGVVGDVRHRSLSRESRPAYYTPQGQVPFDFMTVVIKTSGDPRSLTGAVQNEVKQLDKELPVYNVKTLDEYVRESVAAPRFNTTLLGIFAGVALILTIVGLYGVMSYSVAQRTNEIGIRMALGAQTSDVLKLIVGQGVKLVLLGLVIGLAGAWAVTRVITGLLFGVGTRDSFTFAVAAILLSLVALVACYLPARRASRVDPLVALRYQ